MFSELTSAVAGAIEGAADLAGLGDPALAPLKEAQKAVAAVSEPLQAPQQQIQKLMEKMKSPFPMDAANQAKGLFENLAQTMKVQTSGDGKNLATGCIAACFIKSIKKKLTKLAEDVNILANKVLTTPEDVVNQFGGVRNKAEDVCKNFEEIVKVVADAGPMLAKSMESPDGLAELGDRLKKLEEQLDSQATKTKESLVAIHTAITSSIATAISTIKSLIGDVDRFVAGAPKKIITVFKPPPPCCCCKVGGEAQKKIEDLLESVAAAIKLDPLLDGCTKVKESLEELDVEPLKAVIEQVQINFKQALQPAKDAAEKAAEAAEALRNAGASIDDPPTLPF